MVRTRFANREVGRIDRARLLLGMSSRSAFLREAVLAKVQMVEGGKVIEIRSVSEWEAIRLIDRHLAKHPGTHCVSDLAEELGVDPPVEFAAVQKLIDEGRARLAQE